eukprot:gnl/TRDRNA2_/TRDRNA2_90581_c0_seq1.p1 gnl/TRDRNA2_/TRDRNA2_90581_c0~~gnl/TRDRNA2_/TRDRNA2_90581_c0_seq1.p1  ORF type:complete len:326 (-),score=37.82 gnl/TRDRNA2_/TRDRNA2_90581_c0_seq1:40-1017(-)
MAQPFLDNERPSTKRSSKYESMPKRALEDGSEYRGEWQGTKKHGEGLWVFTNGDEYEGYFEDDKPHGLGTYVHANGDRFFGQFVDGRKSGHGEDNLEDGTAFIGEYEGDERISGRLMFPDGETYEGNYVNNKPGGSGQMNFPDGRLYEGQFQDGSPSGEGVMTWTSGQTYKGNFMAGLYHGKGTMTWPDASVFQGDFVDGKKHGEGFGRWPDGRSYWGYWENDLQHGDGFTINVEGEDFVYGKWKAGRFIEGSKRKRTNNDSDQALLDRINETAVPSSTYPVNIIKPPTEPAIGPWSTFGQPTYHSPVVLEGANPQGQPACCVVA